MLGRFVNACWMAITFGRSCQTKMPPPYHNSLVFKLCWADGFDPHCCPGVAAFNFLPAELWYIGGTIQAGMKTLMYIPCCIGPGLFKLGSDASHLTLYGFDVWFGSIERCGDLKTQAKLFEPVVHTVGTYTAKQHPFFLWPEPVAFRRVYGTWDLLVYHVTIAAPYPGGIDPRLAVYAWSWDGHYTTTRRDCLHR